MGRPKGMEREFGKHVRKLRQERGLTQQALAEKSTLSVDAVRRVEYGAFSPSLKTVKKLAQGLDISLRTLFQRFERKRRQLLDELCDFLGTRSHQDVSLVWRIVRSILRRQSGPTDQTV